MPDSSLERAIDAATVGVPKGFPEPARFLLYPEITRDIDDLSKRIEFRLTSYKATVTRMPDLAPPVLVLTLPECAFETADAAAFEAAYLMVDEWRLPSVEPELYTDHFPEQEQDGSWPGESEETGKLCFVSTDPRVDANPGWAVEKIHAAAAWEYSAKQGRPTMGVGIVIAQPDTGVTQHPELKDIPRLGEIDLIDGGSKARDPLDIGNKGHGTGTASVMLSRSSGLVTGSAPGATHMPIRAIRTVVRISQARVAEAINHAVDNGAHVITMSLGGLPSLALSRAVSRAVKKNLIVLAAAGNCVRMVVWPARYDNCIAVAGINIDNQMWKGSSRGPSVAFSAPGENVMKAAAELNDDGVEKHMHAQGQGTSFAVAMTAGVAALWLAHHNRDYLVAEAEKYGETLQQMFRRLICATAYVPAIGWDEWSLGTGIVNALDLLKAPLDLNVGEESNPVPPEFTNAESIESMLTEFGGDAAETDLNLYGMELANLSLEASRCCTESSETLEAVTLQVSRRVVAQVSAELLKKLAAGAP